MTTAHKEIERVWRAIVSLVIETRGDWRRNVVEATGLPFTRREHPDDRRAKLVSLTAAGRALVRAENNVPDPVPPALTGLSPRDVKVLAKIFDRASGKRARAAIE